MASAQLSECVEVPASSRLISDSELVALPPSPRRAPAIVADRAKALGLVPHEAIKPSATGRAYRVWPFLIIATLVIGYLWIGAVIR
jgi:hypothetical protein